MSDDRKSNIATMFKSVPGGCVFRAPNTWVFGPPHRYLVNEAQKAEIVAIQTPTRPILWLVVVAGPILCLLAVGELLWHLLPVDFFHGDLTVGQVSVLVGRGLVQGGLLVFVPLQILRWLELRRLRPILAGLPRTDMEDLADTNSGKECSDMDLADLRNDLSLRIHMRDEANVQKKIDKLNS